jgi:hypothetical protein
MHETTCRSEQDRSPAEARKFASLPQRNAILVLGMHRSGTSALSGVLEALGAAGPKTAAASDNWNPRGYFESRLLFPALDEMLASAGSTWDDWRQFDPRWFSSDAAAHYRLRLQKLLIDEFGNNPLIVIKDARICRFAPFMATVLTELNYNPVAILPVRNPLEVASSLRRRDGFALSKSILLWLRHVLDAELHSRQLPRCVLFYEDFLRDWRRQMARAGAEIGIDWPDRSGQAEDKIDQFLTHDLHRERVLLDEFNNHPEVTPWAREAYALLTSIAAGEEGKPLLGRLDALRNKFDEACDAFAPLVARTKDRKSATATDRIARPVAG